MWIWTSKGYRASSTWTTRTPGNQVISTSRLSRTSQPGESGLLSESYCHGQSTMRCVRLVRRCRERGLISDVAYETFGLDTSIAERRCRRELYGHCVRLDESRDALSGSSSARSSVARPMGGYESSSVTLARNCVNCRSDSNCAVGNEHRNHGVELGDGRVELGRYLHRPCRPRRRHCRGVFRVRHPP